MTAEKALAKIDEHIAFHRKALESAASGTIARYHTGGIVAGLQLARRQVARLFAAEKRATRGLKNRGGLTP